MDNKHLNGYIDDSRFDEQVEEQQFFPCCRFCGTQTLPLNYYDSQETANEQGTLKCNCNEAREYQHQVEKQKQREKNIAKLQREIDNVALYCLTHNIDLTDEFKNIVIHAGIGIIDNAISSTKFALPGLKISLKTGKDSVIVIKATYSVDAQFEV